jgi:methionyl-tRNA formyltransferase
LLLDWNQPAKRIVDEIRAFSPAPAARGEIAGTTVKIRRAALSEWKRLDRDPGAILGVSGDAAVVRCGDTAVDVLEVVPPNRGPITGATFAVPVLAKQWK